MKLRETFKHPAFRALGFLLSVLFWVLVWWLVAWKINKPLLLPSPPEVLCRLCELSVTVDFWKIVATSLWRILSGILLSIAIGVPLAFCSAKLPPVRILLHPIMTVIRSTPVASFIVLILLWIGREEVPTIITVLIALPVIWKNVETGILGIDPALLEMSRVFAVPLPKRILTVDIPSVLPSFHAALQTSVGLGWKAGVAAEILARPLSSIGRELYDANMNLESADLFAWTLCVVILSLVIEYLLSAVMKRLLLRVQPQEQRKEESK